MNASKETIEAKRASARVRREVTVGDRLRWTLFDTRLRNSYITAEAAQGLHVQAAAESRQARLDDVVHEVDRVCLVTANVGGGPLEFQAYVLDEIGEDEDGRKIELLFGGLAMQLWGIAVDVERGELDYSHFSMQFVEYLTPIDEDARIDSAHVAASPTVNLTDEQLTDLRNFTRYDDPAAAVQHAVDEYIRYCLRTQLSQMAGRLDYEDCSEELEAVELAEQDDASRACAG